MSPFLGAARSALLDTIETLGAKSGVDIRVGLVEYRDHPPQESSFVTRHYPLTDDLDRMRKAVNKLRADGGGDAPEAVYDGVQEAALLEALPERASEKRLNTIPGVVPGIADRPTGCVFNPRCGLVQERCRAERPALESKFGARVRCHFPIAGGVIS